MTIFLLLGVALNGALGWDAYQKYQRRGYWQDFVAACISLLGVSILLGIGMAQ